MSKLNKVNKNGSLSVILPKSITKDLWKEGDEVNIEQIGLDAILIDRQDLEKMSVYEFFNYIEGGLKAQKQMYDCGTVMDSQLKEISFNKDYYRNQLRQFLLEMIRRI